MTSAQDATQMENLRSKVIYHLLDLCVQKKSEPQIFTDKADYADEKPP